MVKYLRKSVVQVVLAAVFSAIPTLLLALWAGSPAPARDFAEYFHPFLSFALIAVIARRVLLNRGLKGDAVIVLVMILAVALASPKRVSLAVYPYSTPVLLGFIVYALAAWMKSEEA